MGPKKLVRRFTPRTCPLSTYWIDPCCTADGALGCSQFPHDHLFCPVLFQPNRNLLVRHIHQNDDRYVFTALQPQRLARAGVVLEQRPEGP